MLSLPNQDVREKVIEIRQSDRTGYYFYIDNERHVISPVPSMRMLNVCKLSPNPDTGANHRYVATFHTASAQKTMAFSGDHSKIQQDWEFVNGTDSYYPKIASRIWCHPSEPYSVLATGRSYGDDQRQYSLTPRTRNFLIPRYWELGDSREYQNGISVSESNPSVIVKYIGFRDREKDREIRVSSDFGEAWEVVHTGGRGAWFDGVWSWVNNIHIHASNTNLIYSNR